MLLKVVIYQYHGLDDNEKQELNNSAEVWNAKDELDWALEFIATDYLTAFNRARNFLNEKVKNYPHNKRIELIRIAWENNNLKGYVTEMEATAMIKLARDWNVEKDLMDLIME